MPILPAEFKAAFDAAFLVNRKHLHWNTPKRRTAHMMAYIYRSIADSFPGLEIEFEHEEIDAVLHPGELARIEVAIEHENDVKTIGTELKNFLKHATIPLNILITYTTAPDDYIQSRFADLMNAIIADRTRSLMVIINPKDHWPDSYRKGENILWEHYIWLDGKLNML